MNFGNMLRYCALLEQHNDRAWFHEKENYKLYTAAKSDFTELVELLKFRVASVASPDLAEGLIFADAKGLLYRIPRDMRVHKNQPPYNPSWRADLSAGRHTEIPIGYYLRIQPGGRSHLGTGAWCWEAEQLFQVRSRISLHFGEFLDALDASGCELWGDKLKKVPADFDPLDPAAEFLKHKSWLVSRDFADAELTDFEAFGNLAADTAERMEPLRQFFNAALAGPRRDPLRADDWDAR